MAINNKDLKNKKDLLGQYFTEMNVVDFCLDKIVIDYNSLYIEPSFGDGNFIKGLLNNGVDERNILGIELDEEFYSKVDFCKNVQNTNFYDFDFNLPEKVSFIGNPPFRTPAYSLESHSKYIKKLYTKYEVKGIREECVFFLLKTLDLIKTSEITKASIHYILPESIFTNHTKWFNIFKKFILKNLKINSIYKIPDNNFVGVSEKLVFVSFEYSKDYLENSYDFIYDGKILNIYSYFNLDTDDMISFLDIFKETYLGSVPAESIFLSCPNESIEEFKDRLVNLFNSEVDEYNLINKLSYKGVPHLQDLKKNNLEKVKIIVGYIKEIKSLPDYDLIKTQLSNIDNYKEIQHRREIRYYFRLDELKKVSFRYILNVKPSNPSLYFTSNPSSTSTDYFGICSYDVNRNSSPGCCRTVPIKEIENNLKDEFKEYWNINTGLPYKYVADYIVYIGKSEWFKKLKKKYKRLYFHIPKEFDKSFLNTIDKI